MYRKGSMCFQYTSPAPATHSLATRTENTYSSIKSLFSHLVHNILFDSIWVPACHPSNTSLHTITAFDALKKNYILKCRLISM